MEGFISLVQTLHFFLPDSRFYQQPFDKERINFVLKKLGEKNHLPPFIKDKKNDGKAILLREKGNICFQRGNYSFAHYLYTKSITKAATDEILSLAYSNRSAVLYKLNLFRECLTDIDRAFKHGYPEERKPKLLKRAEECQKKLTNVENSNEKVSIPESEKNPQIECARNCIKIEDATKFGRGIVATRKIAIGEVLAVEEAFCSILSESSTTNHCEHCLEICYTLIPCESCTQVLYCSKECQEKAFRLYHQYECPILLSFAVYFQSENKHRLLSLRMTIIMLQKENLTEPTSNGKLVSKRRKEISHLALDWSNFTYAEKTFMVFKCAIFFHLMKRTTFFADTDDDTLKDAFMESLMENMIICEVNTTAIDELFPSLDGPKVSTQTGYCTYSFVSLFNHSCSPNVVIVNEGTLAVAHAVRTIEPGEQCFISYIGNMVFDLPKLERQSRLLDLYKFNCKCRVCQENLHRCCASNNAGVQFALPLEQISQVGVDSVKNQVLPIFISAVELLETKHPLSSDLDAATFNLMTCYTVMYLRKRNAI